MSKTITASTPIAISKHSKAYWALIDSWVLIKRSMTHIIKSPDQLASTILTPIMFLLLFRYVFGGAIDTGPISYATFIMAGIIVQMAAFGATTTSIGIANDMQRGIIDRFRSLPMLSSAVLTGHVVADLVRNTVSTVIMLLVGLLVGFRPTADFFDWLLIFGLILLFTLAISWLSAILGLVVKSLEAVQLFGFVTIFPLTFASAAFAPTDSMPYFLRIFAENQPVTHVIEAIRALMVGGPIGNHGWLAVVWCVGILLVAVPIASHLFARNTAR